MSEMKNACVFVCVCGVRAQLGQGDGEVSVR